MAYETECRQAQESVYVTVAVAQAPGLDTILTNSASSDHLAGLGWYNYGH
jgi:hypothetical protein